MAKQITQKDFINATILGSIVVVGTPIIAGFIPAGPQFLGLALGTAISAGIAVLAADLILKAFRR